eukprot:gb/GECH01001271.1/.p1 GENE.gb/GECH01001271.1/~~gb/GECH01001271.1/.p1  ORF type:complete len:233 (+),score=53.66 gb/GECH01001271.1/:1-699(+)
MAFYNGHKEPDIILDKLNESKSSDIIREDINLSFLNRNDNNNNKTCNTTQPICFLLYNVLKPEECSALIQQSEKLGYQPLTDYHPKYRSNTRVIIVRRGLAHSIWHRVQDYIPGEIETRHRSKCKAIGLNEAFRFCKYEKDQLFKTHFDAKFKRNDHEESELTFMLYLNHHSEFQGGATRFVSSRRNPQILKEIRPEPGMALVFSHDILHDGEPLSDGEKYIMRSDVMYCQI